MLMDRFCMLLGLNREFERLIYPHVQTQSSISPVSMSSGISWHKNANFWLNCFENMWNDVHCALHLVPIVGSDIKIRAASHARTTTTLSCSTKVTDFQLNLVILFDKICVVQLTALSEYCRTVSSNTNESFSVQSQLILQYSGAILGGSGIVSTSLPSFEVVSLSCTKDTRLTFGFTASKSVFLTGAFIPSDGLSEATAHECSCAGKNKWSKSGSFRITPATLRRNTISSSS